MSDVKYNASILIDAIASKHKMKRDDARNFVSAFFDVILEGLQQDHVVKVKGLGTFKLVDVDGRQSIDVTTGKRIKIGGHYRMTFSPENALKQYVNRPFGDFVSTVVTSEEIARLISQSTFVVDSLDDNDDDDDFDDDVITPETPTEEDSAFVIVGENENDERTVQEDTVQDKAEDESAFENNVVEEEQITEERTEDVEEIVESSVDDEQTEPAVDNKISEVLDESSKMLNETVSVEQISSQRKPIIILRGDKKNNERKIITVVPASARTESKIITVQTHKEQEDSNHKIVIAPKKEEPKVITVNSQKMENINETVSGQVVEEPKVEPKAVETVQSVTVEPQKAEKPVVETISKPEVMVESPVEPAHKATASVAEQSAKPVTSVAEPIVKKEEERGFKFDKYNLIIIGIAVVACIIMFFIGRIMGKSSAEKEAKEMYEPLLQNAQATMQSAQKEAEQAKQQLAMLEQRNKEADKTEEKSDGKKFATFASCSDYRFKVVGIKKYIKLESGQSILRIAEKEYGSSEFSSYIIKLNKIKDPDKVNAGTTIAIPKIEPVK